MHQMIDNLPLFSQIKPLEIEAALDEVLKQSRLRITELKHVKSPSWQNFAKPMQALYNDINDFFSPISHLSSVCDTETLRTAYQQCLPKLSTFYTEAAQDPALYQCYQQLLTADAYQDFDPAQKRWLALTLKDLELSGVALEDQAKERFKGIQVRLSELSQQFSNHVLDATGAWEKRIKNINALKGVPEADIAMLASKAQQSDFDGYLLTLDMPAYQAIITYADDRQLRKELYSAYCTRASDQGPYAGKYDNSAITEEILALKAEAAKLLGFDNYSQNSLATKMASSVDEVMEFLNDLTEKAKPFASKELQVLQDFAKEKFNIDTLEAWDMPYVSEHYRQQHFSLSEEVIRQYFPVNKVLEGLFSIVGQLFAITITECTDFDSYHKDVRLFQIEKNGHPIAKFYLDLYAREHKRGGAWMADCRSRFERLDLKLQMPVAFLTCNFRPGSDSQPALLSHTEALTLFHEFGHGLHHMLTKIDISGISGISGVEWDAVELPSQFLENWCWQKEALTLVSAHYQTQEPLPENLLQAMLNARDFNQGLMMLRQIEFAEFDIALHAKSEAPKQKDIQALLDSVREKVCLLTPPAENRFQHGFSHIFAGGYAAGYYSYKWAEVLSSDAFSAFEEKGIFDKKTGQLFLQEILAVGASRPMADSFQAFLGRKPKVDALLRHCGLAAPQSGSSL